MSSSFRLRYFLGMVPTAQKIDSAWVELYNIRDRINQVEASKELARFNELDQLIHSADFQAKKREIINLRYIGSPEQALTEEFKKLENSKPITDYFKFKQSTDFKRFNTIAKSTVLARYFELKKIVGSPEFIQRRKKTCSLCYKGSPEYIVTNEYNSLRKNPQLKRYHKTIASSEYRQFLDLGKALKGKIDVAEWGKAPEVKKYRKFLNSKDYKNVKSVGELGLVARLEQLGKQVGAKPFCDREAFLKDTSRYKTTPDYKLLLEFNGLSKNSDVRFYLKMVESPLKVNYQNIEGSKELAHFGELKSKLEDTVFKQRVSFLQNKKRYLSTPSHQLEVEHDELNNSKLLTAYRQLKKKPELEFFDQWEVSMDENFHQGQLSAALWEPDNFWHSSIAGYSLSQMDEIHAYKGSKNIEINNSVLSIVTKAEKTEGKIWDPIYGIVPRKFDFSSAIINTAKNFKFREGVVEAKVRFSAIGAITSAFSLTGSTPFPQIDVFRSGNKCVGVGVIEEPDKSGISKLFQVKGLNFDKFHVFRLEIFGNLLIWKINNHEVHRERLIQDMGELFINFIGSLHEPIKDRLLPHRFEIDWVRCFRKK